ncbi:MAG: ABC transporter substrate-binding protein [Azospira sp.]|jgi:ABC-type amino acid transport substrate-binding protein|nr:ABC transporter substrate-binding protein [Azospira sp.]
MSAAIVHPRRARSLGWLIVACCLALPLAGRALAGPLDAVPAAPDIRRILERGELVVALPKTDSPPFFYQRDGRLRGVDVALAEGLARELQVGLRFHREADSFNEVVAVIARGEADVASSKLSRTLSRAQHVRFSRPYLELRHALALNRIRFAEMARGRDAPTVVRAFSGSIGVIAHSSYADFVRHNFPAAKIVEYPDWAQLVQALEQGGIDGAYRDEFEIRRLFRNDPKKSLSLRAVTLTDTRDALAMAVHRDAHQLLALIDIYLEQRRSTLRVDDLLGHEGDY